jgi:hypothetical protein
MVEPDTGKTVVCIDGHRMVLRGLPKTAAAEDVAALAERQEGNVRVTAPPFGEGEMQSRGAIGLFPPEAVAEMVRAAERLEVVMYPSGYSG